VIQYGQKLKLMKVDLRELQLVAWGKNCTAVQKFSILRFHE
jgi:hypothetical protein